MNQIKTKQSFVAINMIPILSINVYCKMLPKTVNDPFWSHYFSWLDSCLV